MVQVIEQEFTVRYSFPILFCHGVFAEKNPLLVDLFRTAGRRRHRLLAFLDSGVVEKRPQLAALIERYAGIHADVMDLVAPPVIIAGGEKCKNDPEFLQKILALMEKNHLCRQSFILAAGGGAMLDVVGFGAATVHRGVRLIRMPTTVLGQNDAGVGVKNGINGFGRKNFLGTFAPPFAVINDFDFLATLSQRDLRAGIVEAVKVALIKDKDFFDFLCRERHRLAAFDRDVMEHMIYQCAVLHIDHIGTRGDPFETGSSRPLDFGHWSAHKLEELTENRLNHGEAVAIGIALDSLYSFHCGLISGEQLDAVLALLADLHLKLFHPALRRLDVAGALGEFREHLGGELTVTLPSGIGTAVEVHHIDNEVMRRCIESLAELQNRQPMQMERFTPAILPSGLSTIRTDEKSAYTRFQSLIVGGG